MPAFTLLPVLLLSSPHVTFKPVDAKRVVGFALAVPLAMLIVAPVIAFVIHVNGAALPAAHARQLARQVELTWHDLTKEPLRYVGGDTEHSLGVSAYAKDRPRALPGLPLPPRAELSHRGLVLLCSAKNTGCRNAAELRAGQYGPSVTSEIEIARTYFGRRGRAQRYDMVIVPPREPVRSGSIPVVIALELTVCAGSCNTD